MLPLKFESFETTSNTTTLSGEEIPTVININNYNNNNNNNNYNNNIFKMKHIIICNNKHLYINNMFLHMYIWMHMVLLVDNNIRWCLI